MHSLILTGHFAMTVLQNSSSRNVCRIVWITISSYCRVLNLSLRNFFHTRKQLKITWVKIRTPWWMFEYPNKFVIEECCRNVGRVHSCIVVVQNPNNTQLFGFFFHFLLHKSVSLHIVYVKKNLSGPYSIIWKVWKWGKWDFCGSGAKNYKKNLFVFYYYTSVCEQDLRSYTLFWGSW